MKISIFIIALLMQIQAFGQKSELFNDISFDSSYTIIGIGRGYSKPVDSLQRFWFILNDVSEMNKLRKDLVFKRPVSHVSIEQQSLDIYIIKNKREAARVVLIYPIRGIILSEGLGYPFDTAELKRLHAAHPLRYHSQQILFDTYPHYAAYGNSILNDPKLLFFMEPSLRYEGKFDIITRRTADPSSPYFTLRDVDRELQTFAPANSFQAGYTENDSFNIASRHRVKFEVECSKALYDQYQAKGREKGPWQPTAIDIITFWRDDE